MNKSLYLSGYSGISGNMFIGALLDAGYSEEALRETVSALPVSGYTLKFEKTVKMGIEATLFDVELDPHEHQPHRHLRHIVEIIEAADLSDRVKQRSIAVFTKLAEAEAKVHGTTVEKIHFHEVGAVDAIIDVVGTVSGLEALGIEKIVAGNLRTGFGFIECAHGSMPIPAPATAELLHGIPYTQGSVEKELLTPTGAALIATLCDSFGDRPEGFVTEKTAYGAGGWDLEIPNVLRAELGRFPTLDPSEAREVVRMQSSDQQDRQKTDLLVLETNIDDCNPQVISYAMDRLFDAGALDVWQTPVVMKKGRSGIKLSVLCPILIKNELEWIIFEETTSIGIRSFPVDRTALNRREETTETPWGSVRVKISSLNGRVCSATPEYDDCVALAEKSGVPLKEVMHAAHNTQ
ncbi:nickel pincer cofactor biosynthesis protein LarC [Tichowtungia aerotolerans]|uniref:Putative nickel insertion protein n=1 Tax=Tichowtungia aerotolerans TaxID=2697043 RepID=A0A6P1M2D1_9BACT|nr:nickel pincer cofactor biosynthesis protein LarC [Tichowtungia aerotolerans]QHI68989.1 nickel pincer cofactor biosynthesis protein LarC [Tichowtungia aerotolerans]